ncbi:dolichol-phosphate mannosyltransferase subunit 3 [Odontomachus brunneus]|uniref:dolichol-phosphate mannosyltransferase subunit 3 n=1 Tax=Odontomachus brunneus TaxID=486640 RepID=UPI0013F24BD8|nr:dolichol-phosphate mannosyltransferase subunit 3 [Odontomachus brunneus]
MSEKLHTLQSGTTNQTSQIYFNRQRANLTTNSNQSYRANIVSHRNNMKKLHEWLLVVTGLFSVWYAVLASNSALVKEWRNIILFLPITFLFLFGLFAATVIMYRVFTFNTCKNAAIELQQQIEEAKKDLGSKGIIFKDISTSAS